MKADEPANRLATAVLFAVGLAVFVASLWFQKSEHGALGFTLGLRRWIVIAGLAGLAAIPPVAKRIAAGWTSLNQRSLRQHAKIAVAVSLVSIVYLVTTAVLQDRDLFPKTHDDQSYFLQMRMLASGRLWMPPHPLADFFDTFYVISKPTYASMYFPGAAMLYVPTIWLGLPPWFLPVVFAGVSLGLIYRVIAEVIDGSSALIIVVMMLSLNYFRTYSILLTGHGPMLMLGLLGVWSYLRWRRTESSYRRWAILIGVFVGWAAITRPADAVCFAIPIGLGVLLDSFRRETLSRQATLSVPSPTAAQDQRGVRRFWISALLIVVSAAPFLSLQLVFNRNVTGKWGLSPHSLYHDLYQPGTSYGFHPYDPTKQPETVVPQKIDYFDEFMVDFVRNHQPDRVVRSWTTIYLPVVATTTLPARYLLVFLPLGIAAAWRRRLRLLLALPVLLFVLVYLPYAFMLEHYTLVIAPAVLLLTVLGARRLAAAFATSLQPAIRASLTTAMLVTACAMLPEFNALWGEARYRVGDETISSPFMRSVHNLPQVSDLEKPAVVLFKYAHGATIVDEPVYNLATPWPDDSQVIFAHDLGDRDREIFHYFAVRQPQRVFYRYDRGDPNGTYERLGTAKELDQRPR